jgi:hypothetical protein
MVDEGGAERVWNVGSIREHKARRAEHVSDVQRQTFAAHPFDNLLDASAIAFCARIAAIEFAILAA